MHQKWRFGNPPLKVLKAAGGRLIQITIVVSTVVACIEVANQVKLLQLYLVKQKLFNYTWLLYLYIYIYTYDDICM